MKTQGGYIGKINCKNGPQERSEFPCLSADDARGGGLSKVSVELNVTDLWGGEGVLDKLGNSCSFKGVVKLVLEVLLGIILCGLTKSITILLKLCMD